MQAEIIAVGSELLLGKIVDTNSAFIAREFAAAGLDLYHKITVGDNLARPDEVRRLTGDADVTGSAGERAERLAEAVRKWSGVEIGLATVFEDVPDATAPVTVVGIAVARGGRRVGREPRLGGDRPSLRIRTAPLAVDLPRRSLS